MHARYLLLPLVLLLSCSAPPDTPPDWLVTPFSNPVEVEYHADEATLVLTNGLIQRTFRTAPNAATVGYDNLITETPVIRAVKPEARLQIDGTWYDVGGLEGQPDHAYLTPEWLDAMTSNPEAFQFKQYAVGPITPHLAWARKRYAANTTWPPPGKTVSLTFEPPDALREPYAGLRVVVHYEMYQGLPALAKWLTIHNDTARPIVLDAFVSEVLAAVEVESVVEPKDRWMQPPIHVQSDYAFHGMDPASSGRTTRWLPDPDYATQVNYQRQTPVLLESKPPLGPAATIAPGDSFATFRTYELLFDSDDRERRGLALRRLYRTVAPWVTENPIFMHVRHSDAESVRRAIDQSAEVGFEMVIITFGSGFDMENDDPAYIAEIKTLVDYAHSRGIELGGYSLLSSRRISDNDDVINPETGQPGGAIFGNAPCLGSRWGADYFRKLTTFIEQTGLDVLEHDGPYPGDVCASTQHPGHDGLADSQWRQWTITTDFYAWNLARGVYLNVPDFYFLNGSTKVAMGYRETNWSLPRAQQLIHARQNIYDGTWEKTPSMGWMFVPLVEYHGGGEAATLEPLAEHLGDYEAHLANLFGAGVMAAYRGPRLYDSDSTRAVVKKWVDFYKRYRAILDSDVIHLRRADGRDFDGLLHVNPQVQHKGLAVLYNPTDRTLSKNLKLPLYYTGLTKTARIREQEGRVQTYKLDRAYNAYVPLTMEPHSVTWFVIE